MARSGPLSDETRDAVVRLHGEGYGCNAIARELGISAGSVSKIARDRSLKFDRAATDLATRARTIDLAHTRTLLLQKMSVAASDLLDEIDGPYLVYAFGGRDNTYEEHLLDAPPVEVRRTAIIAAGATVDRVSKYLDTRPDTSLTKVESMIDRLAASLEAEYANNADEWDSEFLEGTTT